MIITHLSPDWDAIGAAWLLQKYGGLGESDVVFVNTGAPDPELLVQAVAVVDTGRELDPARLRFDHHHLPGSAANDTCAAMEVWTYLQGQGAGVEHLHELIALILAGDTGRQLAEQSRRTGIHALLSAEKTRLTRLNPPMHPQQQSERLYAFGCSILEALDASAKARQEAQEQLAQYTTWMSDDGLVRCLVNAPQGATWAAFEDGARLVVFANLDTNAIGCQRGGEGDDPHVGDLVRRVVGDTLGDEAIASELSTWFRHPAGFFAGRGTAKAPREDPVEVSPNYVAQAISKVWKR